MEARAGSRQGSLSPKALRRKEKRLERAVRRFDKKAFRTSRTLSGSKEDSLSPSESIEIDLTPSQKRGFEEAFDEEDEISCW